MSSMLSKQQFLEKHKAKFDKSGLSAGERSKRFKDYQLSKAVRTVNPGERKIPKSSKANGGLSYSSMSECTKTYAKALVDPWGVNSAPCVPDNITLPSYKVGYFARGTFTVGTLGDGWIVMNPYSGMGSSSSLLATSSAYPANDFTPAAPGTFTNSTNSPYAIGVFAPLGGMKVRLVAAGIKVRYIGPELTRSGRVIEYRHPTNLGIPADTFANLLKNRETQPGPVDRQWHYVIWRPAVPDDLAYFDTTSVTGAYCLLFAVQGCPPGAAFEYDAMFHYELIGDAAANSTPSHSDPLGMAVISASLATHQPNLPPEENWKRIAKSINRVASTTLSFVGPSLGVPSEFISGGSSFVDSILDSI